MPLEYCLSFLECHKFIVYSRNQLTSTWPKLPSIVHWVEAEFIQVLWAYAISSNPSSLIAETPWFGTHRAFHSSFDFLFLVFFLSLYVEMKPRFSRSPGKHPTTDNSPGLGFILSFVFFFFLSVLGYNVFVFFLFFYINFIIFICSS